MKTPQVAFVLLGLVNANPMEIHKRSLVAPRPVSHWADLPDAVWCYKVPKYSMESVHGAAASRTYECTQHKDGYQYCKYALHPITPMFESYIVGKIKPGHKMAFHTAEIIETVWDDDGEGQHAKAPIVSLLLFRTEMKLI